MTNKTKAKAAKQPRKPHNARVAQFGSLDELLTQMGAEQRTARVDKREVTMPRIDRLLRVMVARALDDNVRELTQLLKIMAQRPRLAATVREEFVTVLSGSVAKF